MINNKTPPLFGLLVCTRSMWTGNDKPCDEAFEVSYLDVDRWTIDAEEVDKISKENWYKRGKNHREESGQLVRDFDRKRWMVKIDDADALRAFCLKYGDIILSVDDNGLDPCFKIEIYDGYRE